MEKLTERTSFLASGHSSEVLLSHNPDVKLLHCHLLPLSKAMHQIYICNCLGLCFIRGFNIPIILCEKG